MFCLYSIEFFPFASILGELWTKLIQEQFVEIL